MSFSSLMTSLFLHRCRRFSIKRQNSQSVRTFHKHTSIHIISWEEYLLNMQINSRVRVVESFIRPIFFNSSRRSRARFLSRYNRPFSFPCTYAPSMYTLEVAYIACPRTTVDNPSFYHHIIVPKGFPLHFFQNEWTFKAYKYKTLYMSDQAFYMWNLLYISKSSDERSSFIVVDYVDI